MLPEADIVRHPRRSAFTFARNPTSPFVRSISATSWASDNAVGTRWVTVFKYLGSGWEIFCDPQSSHSTAPLILAQSTPSRAFLAVRTATNRRQALGNDRFREMIESPILVRRAQAWRNTAACHGWDRRRRDRVASLSVMQDAANSSTR